VSPSRKPTHFGVFPFPVCRCKGKRRSGGPSVGRRRRRGRAERHRRRAESRLRRTHHSAATREGGLGPGPRRCKPLPCRRVSPAPSRRRLHRRPTVSGDVLLSPPSLAKPCRLCRLRRTPALYGQPSCRAPSRELVSVLAMSGLRTMFACRFPSPPPWRRPLCTPAREGQTFARQDHAEGHPTMRRRAARRAHVVPRASMFWPSSHVGFV
jgi:hypothetical protein